MCSCTSMCSACAGHLCVLVHLCVVHVTDTYVFSSMCSACDG